MIYPGGGFRPGVRYSPVGKLPPAAPHMAPACRAPPTAPAEGRYAAPMGYNVPGVANANIQQPYSNVTKRYPNWNICYSCGFNITSSHTSMSCPMHLCRSSHDVDFIQQNAQQYITLGHQCSIKNRHKTWLPNM
jgi:hypothetical protein